MEPEKENQNNANNQKRKKLAFILMLAICIAGIAAVYVYTNYKKTHISTDDAYVTGRIHVIASKVPGTVRALHGNDNQFVKKGQLLLEIDEKDYDVRRREAQSALITEQSKTSEAASRIDVARKQLAEQLFRKESAKANLELQEANLRQAEADLKRAQILYGKQILPEEKLEKAKTACDVMAAQVQSAREQLKQAEAALLTQTAVIAQAESASKSQADAVKQKQETLAGEDLRYSYTRIYAPADGYIAKRSVEEGNQIQAGQPLMAVVPLDGVWIVANYKETEIGVVRPGQKVKIKVDTFPGHAIEGTVDSIMAGTGAVFSLFPPENATGNYIKVVQRIPVKITFDNRKDPNHILRVGMSVVPTILVEN